jgi:metal-responsive CopG/Arc/MetJ family transcriptional regulator
MAKPKKSPYVSTGVNLETEVVEFLNRLATQEERPRSFIINRIIRDYAERTGTPLQRKGPDEEAPTVSSETAAA